MRKFKLILSIVALVFTVAVTIPVIYSWYISTDRVADMSFDILQIDSLVVLYKAEDSNYNGVPDLSATENVDMYYNAEAETYVPYAMPYYTEKYAFDYVDQKYALSFDSEANLLNELIIDNALPSKVYGYKFEITNYIGKENELEFTFVADNSAVVNTLKDFDVRLGVVDANGKVTFTDWTPFCTKTNDTYTYSGFELNPFAANNNKIKVPDKTGQYNVGRLDLWLQVRINPSSTNSSITNFKLPYYRISLSCDIVEENS